ncbi:MAG: hypothetical protein QOD99_3218 [Chthoniobacter sp.]|jgi:uncharacterized protein Yka (UPF0111/DUF47 family)|nr:hypothetical protein [Chthoniobacter sp.]
MLNFNLVLNAVGLLCWGVCFWWMHRISQHQDAMLAELHAVTQRIEKLSKAEHDLIKEVHPKIQKIEEHVGEVVEDVRASNS